ncbi:MAG: hypothetical protein Q7T62_04110 [Undibacterium sp.]|nr:hypothetical protein [Undibacterium sp.]
MTSSTTQYQRGSSGTLACKAHGCCVMGLPLLKSAAPMCGSSDYCCAIFRISAPCDAA